MLLEGILKGFGEVTCRGVRFDSILLCEVVPFDGENVR